MSKFNDTSLSPDFSRIHDISDIQHSYLDISIPTTKSTIKLSITDLLLRQQTKSAISNHNHKKSINTHEDKENNKQLTFRPSLINKCPEYLNTTSFLTRNEQWQKQRQYKMNQIVQSAQVEKEEAIKKQCTFKPKIVPSRHQPLHKPNQPKYNQLIPTQSHRQEVRNRQKTEPQLSMQAMQQHLHRQLLTIDI